MSHTVKIQTKFTQLDPLRKAFAHFGWVIKENSTARTYSSNEDRTKVFPFLAVNPQTGSNAYDLGIQRNETTGELDVLGDFYGGSVAQTLGENLSKLKGEYAYRVIEERYTYEGASVMRTVNQDGSQTVNVEYAN